MKLYKYRSLENLEYTLDLLLNERLHCAPYDKLNDPFEGVFLSVTFGGGSFGATPFAAAPFGGGLSVRSPQSVSELPIPGGTRVCSLSASRSDVRLWSYYANGHTGIAIEIDFVGANDQLHEVEYVAQLKEFGSSLLTASVSTEILRVKSNHWAYEQEYRLISDDEYYPVSGKISGIYFGLRTPPLMQEMMIRSVAGSIPVFSTKLNENTFEIELNEQLN